jgi:membrane protein YqaA with SNARE-associated domain
MPGAGCGLIEALRTSLPLMITFALEQRVRAALEHATGSRRYPLVVGGVALVLTLSMSVPFASALVLAVLLRRERWRAITLWSALGSSIGGLLLYLVFHHLGWNQLVEWYPDIAASKSWRDATQWVTRYGAWALFLIAASPLPQTPALAFAAITRLPVPEVLIALLAGKLIKYGVYAWLVTRFPERFTRYLPSNSFARL